MIEVYTRDGCATCTRIKRLIENYGVSYSEKKIGEDVTRDYVLEQFPNHRMLPIVVMNGDVYSGSAVEQRLLEYKEGFDKTLLTEIPTKYHDYFGA